MWKFYIDGQEVDEPIGWDSVEFVAQRLEAHGVDQPFVTELTWIGKGAVLLKNFFDAQFINATVDFTITSQTKVSGQEYVFIGYIDFGSYREQKTKDQPGWQITVGVLEDDFREKFMSRQDAELDLIDTNSLDQTDIGAANLDVFRNHSQILYLVGAGRQYQNRSLVFGTPFEPVFPIFFNNSDFKGVFGSTFNNSGNYITGTNVFFQDNQGVQRNLKTSGRCQFDLKNRHPFNSYRGFVNILIIDDAGNPTATFYTLFTTPPIPPNNTYSLDDTFVQNIVVPANYRAAYYIALEFNPVGGWETTFYASNTLMVEELNGSTATSSKGYYPFDFLDRAIAKIVGYPGALVSDIFTVGTGCLYNFELTTGLFIRNGELVPDDDTIVPAITAKMITSWQSIFEGLDRIFCLGWGFEQDQYGGWKIRVEQRDYFYNKNLKIAQFNKVSQIEKAAMQSEIANNFLIGYSDRWKNRSLSGTFEINTSRSYYVSNRARKEDSTNKIDNRSNLIAAGYAIEFYRRLAIQVDSSGSSDQPNDNDIFIIWLNYETVTINPIEGSGYDLPGESGSVTFPAGSISWGSNFIAESNSPMNRLYNVFISPARIAARFWKWYGMHTFGLPTNQAKLFYQGGEYFTGYSSRIAGESAPEECIEVNGGLVLSEETDISPAILNQEYWEYILKPITLQFSAPQSLCDFLSMVTPGTGYIEVNSGKETFYGFIRTANNKPIDPSSGISEITLLLAYAIPALGDYSDDYSDDFSN